MGKSSFAEALAQQARSTGGAACAVCDVIPTLSADDVTALSAALDDPRFTGTMIVRALKECGAMIPISTLRRHRRKECAALRS
jgi:hypothetical protein